MIATLPCGCQLAENVKVIAMLLVLPCGHTVRGRNDCPIHDDPLYRPGDRLVKDVDTFGRGSTVGVVDDGTDERYARILAMRQQEPPMTLQAISDAFGISRERVRQILARGPAKPNGRPPGS